MDAARRPAAIGEALLGKDTGIVVESVLDESPLAEGQSYALRLEVKARAVVKSDTQIDFGVSTIAGHSLPLTFPVSRRTDLLLAAPLRIDVTATVQMPSRFKATLPRGGDAKLPVGEYSLELAHRGGVITLTRRVGFFARSVPVARYGELKAFVDQLATSDLAVVTTQGED